MTKRRTILAKTPRLRDRRTGRSPYAKYRKVPYKYNLKDKPKGEAE